MAFAGNCTVASSTIIQDDHIIVASILPIVGFASKVGGEKINVFEMIPSGASPHTYEPTPGQLEKVSKAEMYLAVGSGIEFEIVWLDKIIAINDDMVLVDCSKGIGLIDISQNPETKNGDNNSKTGSQEISGGLEDNHERIGKDPHIWLSPKNAAVMVENIYLGLSAVDPDNEDYFYDNKVDFLLRHTTFLIYIEIALISWVTNTTAIFLLSLVNNSYIDFCISGSMLAIGSSINKSTGSLTIALAISTL
ncbi:unnamed protein product [marine sediment metagenome]|uniref:Zinc ABC transporter substrate-binding protein n=1 Tax=marine sediment metagenome TaxID=412755 RepID=X1BET0_9ZZZZ